MPHALMQFFKHQHLNETLQPVSKKFGDLAREMDEHLEESPEKTTALRKLLEAKDCAVRATFYQHPEKEEVEAVEATDDEIEVEPENNPETSVEKEVDETENNGEYTPVFQGKVPV